ncbi:hypothetical protein F5Y04DRAFT_278990 [Hypomontagnella monticulosa]|nr:hypothetical protein F5Y04DRAFT_278990 [Hypomontagnella monticulosa]
MAEKILGVNTRAPKGVGLRKRSVQAKASILRAIGALGEIISLGIDFSTFSVTTRFAKKVQALVPQLHVVLLNAGVGMPDFRKDPEGHKIALQLCAAATAFDGDDYSSPHLTFTSSRTFLDLVEDDVLPIQTLIERMNDASKLVDCRQYDLVKLCAFFCVLGLAERLRSDPNGRKIVINAAEPGLCKTDLPRYYPLVGRIFMFIFYLIFVRTIEQGARTLVGATALGLRVPGGFGPMIFSPTDFMLSERFRELQRETWDEVFSI